MKIKIKAGAIITRMLPTAKPGKKIKTEYHGELINSSRGMVTFSKGESIYITDERYTEQI